MLTSISAEGRRENCLRLFNPYRDLGAVTDLIAATFSDELGPTGRATLAEMRRVARLGRWFGWLYGAPWCEVGPVPGFVWVEDGRIVGNVSLRRTATGGGFIVGNVAVHPNWRRQGIATALMDAAIQAVSGRGGRWIGLEVQIDNQPARQLYDRLGFEEIGLLDHMLRSKGTPWDEGWVGMAPLSASMRKGTVQDAGALYELACSAVTEPQRALLEIRPPDYRPGWQRTLDRLLEGKREAWWVVEAATEIRAAIRVLRHFGRYPHRLEVLVAPDARGLYEEMLLKRGMTTFSGLSNSLVEILIPNPWEALASSLEKAGFRTLRSLVQMRLEIGRRIPVRIRG